MVTETRDEQAQTQTGSKYFTIREAASRLGVHVQTLRRWEHERRYEPPARRNGKRLFTTADISRIEAAVFSRPSEPTERPSGDQSS